MVLFLTIVGVFAQSFELPLTTIPQPSALRIRLFSKVEPGCPSMP